MAWPNLPYGNGPGEWSTIRELLRSAAHYDFASGQKMTINGTVCGNVANASSVEGNGDYSNTGTVLGTQWVGPTGPIHSTYTSQAFNCQWYTPTSGLPPGCNSDPKNEPSDQLFVDIAIASNTAKALTPTQTYTGIDTNSGDVTITVTSGLNVINVPPDPYGTTEGKLQVRGTGDLIVSGPSDAVVIFNVGADNEINAVRNGISIENGRSVLATGGVQAQNILFNVIGGDAPINAGVVDGNVLVRAGSDVKGKANIQGTSRINGVVIGDGNHSSEFSLAEGAVICSAVPSIDIEKLVSVDGGTTFQDADVAPGPTLDRSLYPNVQFRFVITNTGTEQLLNIDVTDDVYGTIAQNQALNPSQSFEVTLEVGGTAGNHANTATATGTGAVNGETVTDRDPAHYVGTEIAVAIDIQKYVSPNGGTTWFDADEPPGPVIVSSQVPMFKFVVTNTGSENLINVAVTDSILIPPTIVNLGLLEPGNSNEQIRAGTWSPGEHFNLATATGTGQDSGTQVTDTDPANWFGVEEVSPSVMIEKLISLDNGETFESANTSPGPLVPEGVTPQFKLVVTNNGSTPLTNLVVTDLTHGFSFNIPEMVPGEVREFLVP